MRRIFALTFLTSLCEWTVSLALSAATLRIPTPTITKESPIHDYALQVLSWLDSESISWNHAQENIPLALKSHCPTTSTFVELEQSRILLHLIPTPTCLEDCLPPTLNRKLTEWSTRNETNYTKIIHLHQDIWIHKNAIVQARLLVQSQAKTPQRIFARKTTARRITAAPARAFLSDNHLWSATKARYSYGLFMGSDDETLVAVATFSKCRKVHRNDTLYHSYELIRYCSHRDTTVVGGISKLLKQFIRDCQNSDTYHNEPMDIVTMVDRDWGAATGWEDALNFQTMSILDPLVMAVSPLSGQRRYLVGAGLQHENVIDEEVVRRRTQSGLPFRMGLPREILQDLNATSDPEEARRRLAQDDFYPVYDAGVERLYMLVQQPQSALDAKTLWRTATPKYTTRYYSSNSGIVSLLQHAATECLDAPIHAAARKSWKGTTFASSQCIYAAQSSMDPQASIEVCQRAHGWRTMRFVKPSSHKVSSIYHGIYKVDPINHRPEPEIVIQEHLKTMAVLSLMATAKQSSRFLHFGYGAGTLVRLLAHHASESRHVAVELDRAVVQAAKCTLPKELLPTVIVQDAIHYVEQFDLTTTDPFDCICIDVFDEQNFVPDAMYSPSFLRRLRDVVLAPGNGRLVWNFHSGGKRRTQVMQDAYEALTRVFGDTHCGWVPSLDSTATGGNAILVAWKDQPLPVDGDGNLSLTKLAVSAQAKYGLCFDAVARVQLATRTVW